MTAHGPHFIGIGAQKAATSWIAECLRGHPDICIPKKETHFFNRKYKEGVEIYLSTFSVCSPGLTRGEFTPDYLTHPSVAKRIHINFPDTKLVVCLRNPVDRAYSQYQFSRRSWIEKDFMQAIKDHPEIIERGMYAKHLNRFFEYFSREKVLILIYEDIEKNPVSFIQHIYRFLEVDDTFIPKAIYTRQNTGKSLVLFPEVRKVLRSSAVGRNVLSLLKKIGLKKLEWKVRRLILKMYRPKYQPLKGGERNHVHSFYMNDIKELEVILDRTLDSWK